MKIIQSLWKTEPRFGQSSLQKLKGDLGTDQLYCNCFYIQITRVIVYDVQEVVLTFPITLNKTFVHFNRESCAKTLHMCEHNSQVSIVTLYGNYNVCEVKLMICAPRCVVVAQVRPNATWDSSLLYPIFSLVFRVYFYFGTVSPSWHNYQWFLHISSWDKR